MQNICSDLLDANHSHPIKLPFFWQEKGLGDEFCGLNQKQADKKDVPYLRHFHDSFQANKSRPVRCG